MKKQDLPAWNFYIGDWMKSPEIRALTLPTRMIWFEMLCFMWESTERGYLTINGKNLDNQTNGKNSDPQRYVVTLEKSIDLDTNIAHHHFARMTFDQKGKLVKFTTSR